MARSFLCRSVGVLQLLRTQTPLSGTRCYSHTEPEPLTLRQQHNGIRRIILNDPKKRNALSLAMLESLRENLLTDADSDDLRVVIISARGPVFSSGHDLKELTSAQGREYHTRVFHTCSEVMTLIQDIPVPVIAMVNGVATAAVVSWSPAVMLPWRRSSPLSPPRGVNVGLFCSTPAVAIGRAVPRKVAMEMLLTGSPLSAHNALLHGLISESPGRRPREGHVPETNVSGSRRAYATASRVMVDNLALRDGQEGIRAFIEKRKPVWSNKAEKAQD
ncbi:hypothetical protein CesoFtcFv8_026309 [Champsocephalus esox]|uniref:Enoyl-CoA hydratase domain-containing protein 3, mitochondrial n=1 Tax=Champsocephalus esox TaxID=159716 RepID=A0AAN8B2R2_9TELE|nr:hypothetical protein CesoFtcFv8_026309 [Champsocephalus esox]